MQTQRKNSIEQQRHRLEAAAVSQGGIKDCWWTTEASRKNFKSRVLISPQTFPRLRAHLWQASAFLNQQSATCQGLDLKFVLSRIVGEYIGVVFPLPILWLPVATLLGNGYSWISSFFYCNCVNPFPNNLTCKETIAKWSDTWVRRRWRTKVLVIPPSLPLLPEEGRPTWWMAFCHGPHIREYNLHPVHNSSVHFLQNTLTVTIRIITNFYIPLGYVSLLIKPSQVHL